MRNRERERKKSTQSSFLNARRVRERSVFKCVLCLFCICRGCCYESVPPYLPIAVAVAVQVHTHIVDRARDFSLSLALFYRLSHLCVILCMAFRIVELVLTKSDVPTFFRYVFVQLFVAFCFFFSCVCCCYSLFIFLYNYSGKLLQRPFSSSIFHWIADFVFNDQLQLW